MGDGHQSQSGPSPVGFRSGHQFRRLAPQPFGVHDQNIKYLESLLDVQINGRGHTLAVDGDPKDVETVERILEDFSELFAEGRQFTDKELRDLGFEE